MRFPYKAYAKMVAQEEKSISRQVATDSADEKKTISESAIENDDDEITEHDDTDDVSGSEDDISS